LLFQDYKCKVLESHLDGTLLKIGDHELWTNLIGEFNAYNIVAVYGCAMLLVQEEEKVLTALSSMSPVNGRAETIISGRGVTAIVDYAHTPDALENILVTIRKIVNEKHKIITVIGAGGDRDRKKRPLMGRIAAFNSNRVILTSDNPRTEDPEKILDDMESGITPEMKSKTLRITDRREAIKTAVMLSQPGDVILLAGKGHETYQEVNGVKHHFDDRIELRLALST